MGPSCECHVTFWAGKRCFKEGSILYVFSKSLCCANALTNFEQALGFLLCRSIHLFQMGPLCECLVTFWAGNSVFSEGLNLVCVFKSLCYANALTHFWADRGGSVWINSFFSNGPFIWKPWHILSRKWCFFQCRSITVMYFKVVVLCECLVTFLAGKRPYLMWIKSLCCLNVFSHYDQALNFYAVWINSCFLTLSFTEPCDIIFQGNMA